MTKSDNQTPLPESHPAHAMLRYLSGKDVDSVLIIAAHPDDEIVGVGVAMASLPNLTVVHVTDGVPNDPRYSTWAGFKTPEDYRRAREVEGRKALDLLGVRPAGRIRLGFVDQQLSRNLVPLTQALARVIHEHSPDLVITHPYEGGHPDHDATCFATHHALWLLEQDGEPVPTHVEMTSYFCRYGERVVSEFAQGLDGAVSLLLEDADRVWKKELYGCFESQKDLLNSFPMEVERFRLVTGYDFSQLPQVPEIFYDRHELGTRSYQWLKLSRAAIKKIKAEVVRQQCWQTDLPEVRKLDFVDQAPTKQPIRSWLKQKRAAIKTLKAVVSWQQRWRTNQPSVGKVDFGDLARTEPISRFFGYDRGTPIDRPFIENFLRKHREDIRGRVLEIGDNSYTSQFGAEQVIHSDILHVNEGADGATIIGDLSHAPQIPDNTFDCLILTQVLVCIFDLPGTIATIYRILKPGGVVLITVPGISNIDKGEWHDYWMWCFTPNSLRKLLLLQFSEDKVDISSRGNVFTSIAFLQGLCAEDLACFPVSGDDPCYPQTVLARAVK